MTNPKQFSPKYFPAFTLRSRRSRRSLEKQHRNHEEARNSAQTRVWQATFAGPNAGSIAVGIEYPSMAAFADADAKTHADKDYLAWLRGLDKIRTIVSDSLYKEL